MTPLPPHDSLAREYPQPAPSMPHLIRITAIFAIVSSACMLLLWFSFSAATMQEFRHAPVAFCALMVAESVTAAGLLLGGLGTLAGRAWAYKVLLISLGMLLYAVIYACGQFAQRGNALLALLFGVVALATLGLVLANAGRR